MMNSNTVLIQHPSNPSIDAGSAALDPPPEDGSSGTASTPPSDLGVQQYQSIGAALMAAECSKLSVGLPWRAPSRKVRQRREQFEEPLSEFLRYSLVGVSTKTLESYCDDLEEFVLEVSNAGKRDFFIDILTPIERYAFSVVASGALFLICFLGFNFLGLDAPAALLMAMLSSGVTFFGCVLLSQESGRRNSLHIALYHELLRRQGLDEGNGNGLRLMSIKPN